MTIHITPSAEVVRVYRDGASYAHRDQYDGCCQVLYGPPSVAVVTGMHGTFARQDLVELMRHAQQHGARHLLAERAPGHRLPWGHAVDRGPDAAGWWEIDIEQALSQ